MRSRLIRIFNWSYLCALVLAFIATILAVEHSPDAERQILASNYHQEALNRANAGNLDASLPLFRAAIRLAPSNLLYLNDLGVTEMRLGDYHRAQKRFLVAIEQIQLTEDYDGSGGNSEFLTSDSMALARENLLELKNFMSEGDFYRGLDFNQLRLHFHQLLEPVEVSARSLMDSTLQQAEISSLLRAPFVSRGALKEWKWDFLTSDFATNKIHDVSSEILKVLLEAFGDDRVDFYPQGMSEEHSRPFFASLREAISYMYHPQDIFDQCDASRKGTYVQWNMNSASWYGAVSLLAADRYAKSKLHPSLPPMFDDTWMEHKNCFGMSTELKNLFSVSFIARMREQNCPHICSSRSCC